MEARNATTGLAREKVKDDIDCDKALKSPFKTDATSDSAKAILGKITTTVAELNGIEKDLPTTSNITCILGKINDAVAVLNDVGNCLPAGIDDNECHLLDAPAEIRNEIWLLVLDICEPVCLNGVLHHGAFHGKPRRFKVPQLLHVNHQIRHETAGLFYSKTTFLCHFSATTMSQCLNVVDKDHLKLFRNIECRSYDGTRSARLFLQVVLEMLGDRAKLLRKGVMKAALKIEGNGASSNQEDASWISLSEVEASNDERKNARDEGNST